MCRSSDTPNSHCEICQEIRSSFIRQFCIDVPRFIWLLVFTLITLISEQHLKTIVWIETLRNLLDVLEDVHVRLTQPSSSTDNLTSLKWIFRYSARGPGLSYTSCCSLEPPEKLRCRYVLSCGTELLVKLYKGPLNFSRTGPKIFSRTVKITSNEYPVVFERNLFSSW